MQDMTQGSIPRHLVRMAAPLAAGMVFQTLSILAAEARRCHRRR
jgi:hypothetical protein